MTKKSTSKVSNRVINCEIFSRVVGYFRPTNQWNSGKQSEFEDRNVFNEEASLVSHLAPNPILKETIITSKKF